MVTNKYSTIVSDPCWQYSNWTTKAQGAAAAHYQTMTLNELKKIPVDTWQADNCIHFMWCTLPKIPEGIELLNAWGLDYVTSIPWVKTLPNSGDIRRGIGFWTMTCVELLLIGRKGVVKRDRKDPVIGLLFDNMQTIEDKLSKIFYAPIQGHSKKDESVQTWIERSLSGPYLELFSTRERDNWTTWGYSTGYSLSERGVEKI